MSEHAHLSAMGGFVSKHVAEHFSAHRPGPPPAVSVKLFDLATAAERFCEHLLTASGTLGQSCAGLFRCAARAVELRRNLKVRSRKPDPLRADGVQVREDPRKGADVAGWFCRRSGSPGRRIQMLDKN